MARRKESVRRQSGKVYDPDTVFPWLRDWHCIALLILPLFFFFREVIFLNAFFWEDFLYQFYPYRNLASVGFAQGEIPLWNPYTFGGMPFQADITGSVFYLPHFLLVPLVSGGRLFFWWVEIYIIAHFLVAGAGMFYLARMFGASRVPATFSALVYMFSAYMVIHVIHLVTLCQIALFPLTVLLFAGALDRRSPRHMILAGFVLSLIVCGGHPQITLYIFFFLLAFFLVEMFPLIRNRRGSGFPTRPVLQLSGLALGVVAIAVLLGAIQLLPTRELADLSLRESITFEKASEGQLYPQQIITALIPKFFGSSTGARNQNPHPYWGPEVFWNFWCTPLYTGFIALALALFALPALVRDRRLLFIAGFAIFSLLYALGDHFIVHRFFYEFVPGFGKFRSVGRWGFFFMFAVALFSGLGLQSLLGSTARLRTLRRIVFVLAGIVGLTVVALQAGLLDRFIAWQAMNGALKFASPNVLIPLAGQIAGRESIVALIVALVSGALLLLVMRRALPPAAAILLLFLVQFADAYVFGGEQNTSTVNPDVYFNERAGVVRALQEEGRTEYFRVNARNTEGLYLDRNQGMVDRIFLTEGYTQLALQRRFPPGPTLDRVQDLMNVKYRLRTDTVIVGNQPRLSLALAPASSYLPRAWFVYDYRVFATAEQESLFLAGESFDPRRTATFGRDPGVLLPGVAPAEGISAVITSYSLNTISLRVSTPERGLLVLSEIHYPGWNARVDGVPVPVHRVNWSLRGCFIDPGEHTVEMRFEPASFYTGASISLATLFLCGLGFSFLQYRKRRNERPPTP